MTVNMTPDRWARVGEIFHDALGRDAESRPAFLDQACGSDQALRTEVNRLLAAHAGAGDFLTPPPAGLTGHRIGRYDVGQLLGRGGMGEVYLARDVELGRDVALKVAIPGEGQEDARLRREAQHASRLNHPHICTIHEVGSSDGRVFVVMEYAEGQRIADLIVAGGLSVDAVVRYGAQIADALAHAHRHGVVHRDLKSTNVVVTPEGRAKVLDFGLARQLAASQVSALTESQTQVTEDGLVAGTLSYMAPELLCGNPADARSDIWALGVLLYEVAAGVRPFTGATGFELSAAILHRAPAPLPRGLPAPLQALVLRCLEKDPAARYQHADDIRAALDTMQGSPTRLPLWSAFRFPSRLTAAALLAFMLAGAAIVVWRSSRTGANVAQLKVNGGQPIAVMPFDNLGGEDTSWMSKGVQNMLLTGLAQTRGLVIVSSERLQGALRDAGGPALESLDQAQASDVARRAGAGVSVVGSIAKVGDAIRIDAQINDLNAGRVLAAESVTGSDLFELVDRLSFRIRDSVGLRDVRGVRPIEDVSSSSLEAYRLFSQGVDAFANMRLESARSLLEEAVAVDPAFAEAYLQLALLSGPAGRPADRGKYLRQAAARRERLSEPRRLLMEVELARDLGEYSEAARKLEELIAAFPELDAISTLAFQLYAPVVGPLPDAVKLHALASGVVAANPSSPLARNVLGYALLHRGRFPEAIRELETYARLAPREPNPYDSLGEAYLMMGLPEKALEFHTRALTIDPMFSSGGRAWTLAILGRYDEALLERHSPPYLTAIMLARLGRYSEARATIANATRAAESSGDAVKRGGFQLLAALLSIERAEYARALDESRHAQMALATLPAERRRFSMTLLELISGIAEIGSGRPRAAASHVESLRRLSRPPPEGDEWQLGALQGELAFAAGDLDRASEMFSRAQPARKQFFSRLVEGSVLANDLLFRDGLARVAKARGDRRGAIEVYRNLLTYGPDQTWVAVFEPRYVLEMARLYELEGDKPSARMEYERFLQFWKKADEDLVELVEVRKALARLRE